MNPARNYPTRGDIKLAVGAGIGGFCRTKVKILVGFCQILVLWPKQILSVRWPDVFVEMTETLKLFSLDFRLLLLDCLFRRDFYSKFIVATFYYSSRGVWLVSFFAVSG